MDISFNQESLQINQQNEQFDIQSSELSQLRKGDVQRRQLLDINYDNNFRNLNNRKDSIISLPNNETQTKQAAVGSNQKNIDEIRQKMKSIDTKNLRNNNNLNLTQIKQNNISNNDGILPFLKINNIKKFIKLLIDNTPQINYKFLQKHHFSFIGDKAHTKGLKNLNKFSKYKLSFKSCKKLFKLKALKPDSKYLIFWDLILVIMAIFFVWASTIELSQQKIFTDEIPFYSNMEIFIIVFFIFDIILNLNVAYYEGFTLIEENSKIIKNYIKNHFLSNFLPIIGYFITQSTQIYIFQFTSLFRIFKMLNLINKIQENFHFQEKYPTATTLVRLLFLIFFVAHMCSCGFVFIANSQPIDVETWIDRQQLTYSGYFDQYIVSLYYAFITMITVGYGDVVPVTITERVFTIFMTLIACGIFAYSVNTIGQIVLQIEQTNADQKKQKYEILNYMEGRNIRKEIQQKIFQYLEQLAQIEQQSNMKGIFVINKLPVNLKNEIYQDFFGKLLKEQDFFTKNFSVDLIEQLSLKMQECIIGPGQIIYNKDDVDRRLYIIRKGEIQFYDIINKQEKDFGKMGKSVMIGLPGFLTGQARIHGTKSINISHIVSLNYDDFIETIKDFPKDYEKYCMLRDSYIQNPYKITPFCSICNTTTHFTLKCPFVFYSPNKKIIINRYNYSTNQERQNLKIQKRKKFKTFINLQELKNCLKQFRVNLVIEQAQDQDFNNSFIELLNNFGQETDKEFFRCTPYYNQTGVPQQEHNNSFETLEEEEETVEQILKDYQDIPPNSSNQLTNEKDIYSISDKNQQNVYQPPQPQEVKSSIFNSLMDNKLEVQSLLSSSDSKDEGSEEDTKNNQKQQNQTKFSLKSPEDKSTNSLLNLMQPQAKTDIEMGLYPKSILSQTNYNVIQNNQSQLDSSQVLTKSHHKSDKQQVEDNDPNNLVQKQIVQFQKIFRQSIRNSLKGMPQFQDADSHSKKKKNSVVKEQIMQNINRRNTNTSRNSLVSKIINQQMQSTNQIENLQDMISDLEANFTKQLNKLFNNNPNYQLQNKYLKSLNSTNTNTKNNTITNEDDLTNSFFTIQQFDKLQKYNIYYPQYNYTNINKLQYKRKANRLTKINKGTIIINQNKNLINLLKKNQDNANLNNK